MLESLNGSPNSGFSTHVALQIEAPSRLETKCLSIRIFAKMKALLFICVLSALFNFNDAIDRPAIAASYPTRNVEIIVAYGAGGSTDFVARLIAQKLSTRLGYPVVVSNRPGGNGLVGINLARRSPPDGHTLFVGYTAETVILPQISKAADFSVVTDFEPVAVTGLVPVVLLVSKKIQANNLSELIDEIRANPGKYTFGGSIGSPPHLMGAWLNKLKNLDVRHVPYRGGAQGVNDLIGGHIDIFYSGVAPAKSAVDTGQVKAIAISGNARSAALKDVLTFKESGLSEFDLTSWSVMLTPQGTPEEIVSLLKREVASTLDDPELREAFAKQGVDRSEDRDVRQFLARERDKFGQVVRELKISGD